MKRFNKKEYTDARKRIRTFIKKEHRLPNYCNMKNQQGKEIKLLKDEYCGLFEGYMHFCLKNGREPNYLTLTSKASNPVVVNYQDDKVSCCPASFLMGMMFLFEYRKADCLYESQPYLQSVHDLYLHSNAASVFQAVSQDNLEYQLHFLH